METLLTTSACTMPTAQRPLRVAEFDALFEGHVRAVERDPELVRMRLVGPADLRERVADLTERETSCCSFFAFTITGCDDDLVLEIRVPPAQREILDSLANRAVELSS